MSRSEYNRQRNQLDAMVKGITVTTSISNVEPKRITIVDSTIKVEKLQISALKLTKNLIIPDKINLLK